MKFFHESDSVVLFPVEENGLTIDDVLIKNQISVRLMRKLKKEKRIIFNNKFSQKNEKVKIGDVVGIFMEDEIDNIEPEDIPLDIIYEDFDLLVINKRPHIVVHPTPKCISGTIANGISSYYMKKDIHKKIRFVNRLDMDTSGIIIVGKNPFAHQQMALQLENDMIEKKYLAVVEGIVKEDEGTIDIPIGKEEKDILNKVMNDGKRSISKYKVLKRYRKSTFLEVQILTGKNHQIRVHMNYIGHPIIGDSLYYKRSSFIDRQALHAWSIKFSHPRYKNIVEFKAPLPEDMKYLIEKLKMN